MSGLIDGRAAALPLASHGAGGPGDAAPAPSAGHQLIDLPFDQYNRHTLVQRAVAALGGAGRRLAILDVGGYPCWTPRFLPEHQVTVLDVQAGPEVSERFVLGDGSALPFLDRSFDVVVTLDSLEDVPRPNRRAFLTELTRVARDYVLLTAPFHRPEVRLAEDLLYEFIQATLKAKHDQLTEHIAFALPEVGEVEGYFDALGLAHARLPSGNVYNWLAMMLAKHFIMTLPDADRLHTTLDRFYNTLFFAADQCEPAYRQLCLVAVNGDPAPMRAFVEREIAPPADGAEGLRRLELVQLLIKLLDLKLSNHQDPRLREQVELRDTRIDQLEGLVALKLEQIGELEELMRRKDRDIAFMQSGLVDQQTELEERRREVRALRQRVLEQRDELAEARVQAAREANELHVEAERHRILVVARERELLSREREIERLNEHIHQIQQGRVMRLLNALQDK